MATNADHAPALRTISLLAAPIVAIVARLVWTPVDDDDPAGYMAAVARHPERTDAGALLMMLSALLLIPAAFGLAAAIRGVRPRVATVTTAMIVTGCVGMAAFSTIGLFASHLAQELDGAEAAASWERFYDDASGEVVFLGIFAGVVGFIALGVSLWRTGVVPRAAAVLTGLGGAATLFTTGGPLRPLLVASAAVALIGFGWVARATTPETATVRRAMPAVPA